MTLQRFERRYGHRQQHRESLLPFSCKVCHLNPQINTEGNTKHTSTGSGECEDADLHLLKEVHSLLAS